MPIRAIIQGFPIDVFPAVVSIAADETCSVGYEIRVIFTETPMLQLMKFRFLSLLFLLSIALPSCMMQKRSIMPGWHIELQGESAATQKAEALDALIEGDADTFTEVLNQDSEPFANVRSSSSEKQSIQRDPLIPVKSLMGLPLQAKRHSRLKTLDAESIDSSQTTKSSRGLLRAAALRTAALRTVGLSRLESSVPQHIGAIRFLLFLLGLPLTLLGVVCLLLVGWDVAFLLPGIILLIAGIVALKWAFTPNSRWGKNKRITPMNSSGGQSSVAKNSNQIQREAMERARVEARRVQAEKRQAQKEKRQAFLQTPAMKAAMGFLIIFGLYALLF